MARKEQDPTKDKRLNATATEEQVEEFNAACRAVGIEPADALRSLAAAFVNHVAEYGYVVQPIRLAGPPARK